MGTTNESTVITDNGAYLTGLARDTLLADGALVAARRDQRIDTTEYSIWNQALEELSGWNLPADADTDVEKWLAEHADRELRFFAWTVNDFHVGAHQLHRETGDSNTGLRLTSEYQVTPLGSTETKLAFQFNTGTPDTDNTDYDTGASERRIVAVFAQ